MQEAAGDDLEDLLTTRDRFGTGAGPKSPAIAYVVELALLPEIARQPGMFDAARNGRLHLAEVVDGAVGPTEEAICLRQAGVIAGALEDRDRLLQLVLRFLAPFLGFARAKPKQEERKARRRPDARVAQLSSIDRLEQNLVGRCKVAALHERMTQVRQKLKPVDVRLGEQRRRSTEQVRACPRVSDEDGASGRREPARALGAQFERVLIERPDL